MTFDRKSYMKDYQKRYAKLHRHQMTVPNLRLVNKKSVKVKKSKTGTRKHRRKKPSKCRHMWVYGIPNKEKRRCAVCGKIENIKK